MVAHRFWCESYRVAARPLSAFVLRSRVMWRQMQDPWLLGSTCSLMLKRMLSVIRNGFAVNDLQEADPEQTQVIRDPHSIQTSVASICGTILPSPCEIIFMWYFFLVSCLTCHLSCSLHGRSSRPALVGSCLYWFVIFSCCYSSYRLLYLHIINYSTSNLTMIYECWWPMAVGIATTANRWSRKEKAVNSFSTAAGSMSMTHPHRCCKIWRWNRWPLGWEGSNTPLACWGWSFDQS